METSSPTLKKRNNDSPTEYLHEDSVILDTSQNITFNNDNHHLQLVPDSPLRKKRHKKSLSSDGYDDSDHNQSLSNSHSDISAIQSIDALSHSAQGSHLTDLNLHQPTNGITVATMPYIATMPVMYNPTAFDYNMLLRSNDTLNSSGGSSEHQNANGAAIASVQFGLPWITGGYPSIPLAVDAEQYQHLIMQQQHQMRPYDARTIQSRDPNINESPHSDSEQIKRGGNMLPNTVSFLSGGRFFLVEQPNVRQRKSYKNENRYILPNPLTVCAREESPDEKLPKIIEGTVSVKLVNSDAAELPSTKQNVLVSPDGSLCLNLDRNNSAHFSLKVLETSEGTMFRLLFNVNFSLEGVGPVEERILSRPFQVYSNRKKNSKAERPIVLDMKPSDGPTSTESEVWIKGRGFTDKVVVLFGDKVGRVTESSENLITVFAPSRYDLPANTTVTVTVSNRTQQDILSADKQLSFTYFVG